MILADKITKLRKQLGWSQEDLAEKMSVSRQSVSKWESTSSIPDLNKIILLAEIFAVTTDFLLKDKLEEFDTLSEDKEPGVIKVNIEDANNYCDTKVKMSKYISIGVFLSINCVAPLLFLLALAEAEQPYLSYDLATTIGLVSIFVIISVAVSFFLRSNQYGPDFIDLEKSNFELTYGVHSIFKDKIQNNQKIYNQKLGIFISMIILSVVPLIVASIYTESDLIILLMVVLMLVIIGSSLYFMIPSITENSTYRIVIAEEEYSPKKKAETRRIEKFGSFYWPLVTAIYIGWSLWTMDWHITWIVWPVAAIAFASFSGLIGMFDSDNKDK